jgi:hypothetical protein
MPTWRSSRSVEGSLRLIRWQWAQRPHPAVSATSSFSMRGKSVATGRVLFIRNVPGTVIQVGRFYEHLSAIGFEAGLYMVASALARLPAVAFGGRGNPWWGTDARCGSASIAGRGALASIRRRISSTEDLRREGSS